MASTYALKSQREHTRHTAATAPRRLRAVPGGAPARCSSTRTCRLSGIEIAVLIAIVIALVAGVLMSGSRAQRMVSQERIRIEHGDTLWSIARNHPVAGQTTAQTADTIADLNGLRSASVQPGQSILVPAAEPEVTLASR